MCNFSELICHSSVVSTTQSAKANDIDFSSQHVSATWSSQRKWIQQEPTQQTTQCSTFETQELTWPSHLTSGNKPLVNFDLEYIIVHLNTRKPWLSYFSLSQSMQCDLVRSYFNDCLCMESLTEGMAGAEFVKFSFTAKHTSVTSTSPHLIFKQPCRTWPQSEPQSNGQMSFPCLPLLASFLLYVPHLLFPNCCRPWLLVFLSSRPILYSSLQPIHHLALSIMIWFRQSLLTKLPESLSIHLLSSLSFPSHLPTNCFYCSNSSQQFSPPLPPYPVQPVTPLLRSIIMAQCSNTEFRTRSIMSL